MTRPELDLSFQFCASCRGPRGPQVCPEHPGTATESFSFDTLQGPSTWPLRCFQSYRISKDNVRGTPLGVEEVQRRRQKQLTQTLIFFTDPWPWKASNRMELSEWPDLWMSSLDTSTTASPPSSLWRSSWKSSTTASSSIRARTSGNSGTPWTWSSCHAP